VLASFSSQPAKIKIELEMKKGSQSRSLFFVESEGVFSSQISGVDCREGHGFSRAADNITPTRL
jgi:hypothetical protein